MIFDKTPHISYRQHENNVIGGKSSRVKKYKRRISNVFINRNRIRERDALELINGYKDLIPEENLKLIKKVAFYRSSYKDKLKLIFDNDIKTNSIEHNLAYKGAVLMDAL